MLQQQRSDGIESASETNNRRTFNEVDRGGVESFIQEAQEKEEDEESLVKVNDDSSLMFNDAMGSMMMSQKNHPRSSSAKFGNEDVNNDVINQ